MNEPIFGTASSPFEKSSGPSAAKNAANGHRRHDPSQLHGQGQGHRADPDRASIHLLRPQPGELTAPLQLHPWPAPPLNPPMDAPLWGWQHYLAEHDRSLPRPVEFIWMPAELPGQLTVWPALASGNGSLSYDLEIAPAQFSGEKQSFRHLPGPSAEIYNLRVGTEYIWQVTARQGRQIVAESPVGQFTTDPTPPRWIRVPGTTNVRDLGGWPLLNGRRIRQGLFYRGSEMNSHCTINEAGKRVLVEELGIRTDVDLRGQGEERQSVLDPSRVQYINLPVLAYDSIASPQYTGRMRALFGLLADRHAYPLYLHCWGGADRTGTIAFLVGALLGMHPDDLATDYELTSLSIWGERLSSSDAYTDLLQTLALFAPTGSTIQTQVDRYLRVIGVPDEEVAAIREILTE